MAYLLDTNVFISAKNLHYGFDFCPAFWEWLVQEHRNGTVFSVEKVGDEVQAGNDDLATWATQLGNDFFLTPDSSTLPALGIVADWVNNHTRYSLAAKNTFLQIADYYLISQALAGRHTVVTHERPENSIHIVKVPDVCLGLNLRYINPFDMLRKERARFVLDRRST